MTGSPRTEAEYAYRLLLVATGDECVHPPQYRERPSRPGPDQGDPGEWRCRICGEERIRLRRGGAHD